MPLPRPADDEPPGRALYLARNPARAAALRVGEAARAAGEPAPVRDCIDENAGRSQGRGVIADQWGSFDDFIDAHGVVVHPRPVIADQWGSFDDFIAAVFPVKELRTRLRREGLRTTGQRRGSSPSCTHRWRASRPPTTSATRSEIARTITSRTDSWIGRDVAPHRPRQQTKSAGSSGTLIGAPSVCNRARVASAAVPVRRVKRRKHDAVLVAENSRARFCRCDPSRCDVRPPAGTAVRLRSALGPARFPAACSAPRAIAGSRRSRAGAKASTAPF